MSAAPVSRFAFVDGRFVPEAEAVVSVLDRSFLYGDGVFETLYAQAGKPFQLSAHLDRLWQGAALLGMRVPLDRPALADAAGRLLAMNPAPVALLRLTLSRGVGVRGYSPRGADQPTLVITQHAAGDRPSPTLRWRLRTATFRLPAGDRIAAIKSCNKLAQVLARAEAEAVGADEAILLNSEGNAVEAAAGNLFFIRDAVVHTPPVVSGILPGVTRSVVMDLCSTLGIPAREVAPAPAALLEADGVFVTLSTLGVVPASRLDDHALADSPLVSRLRTAYWDRVDAECR